MWILLCQRPAVPASPDPVQLWLYRTASGADPLENQALAAPWAESGPEDQV